MCADQIPDDETLYRRIPPNRPWIDDAGVTTANFKLDRRSGEEGISVYRKAIVAGDVVLAMPGASPGSILVEASAGDVRALRDGARAALGLTVVAAESVDNPGHAEIRGPEPKKMSKAASKALKDLFRRTRRCAGGPLAGEWHAQGEAFEFDGRAIGEECGWYRLEGDEYRWTPAPPEPKAAP